MSKVGIPSNNPIVQETGKGEPFFHVVDELG
jgi:hypothetical protein